MVLSFFKMKITGFSKDVLKLGPLNIVGWDVKLGNTMKKDSFPSKKFKKK